MYKFIFGCDPLTPLILGVLGLSREDFGQFKNSFPHEGKYVVLARIAGNPDYGWVILKMQAHALFDSFTENGEDIVFRFHKPTEHYVLPPSFVRNFVGHDEAEFASAYLSRTKDRPLPV